MNLSQLTAFQATMTSASLSDAASKLGRSQPAVSAAIKALEEQLGFQLFRREGRKLVPVPEAHYLLSEANTLLAQMSRVRHTMRSLKEARVGTLSIAAMPGPVSMLFPQFVAREIGQDSGITVSLSARSSAQIIELARAQSIDFAFADALDDPDAGNLYRAEIVTGRCFVAIPEAHPLADRGDVHLADLDDVPMGSLYATHVHQREVLAAFNAQGLRFRAMVESQTFLPLLQFVLAGQCCAIIDPLTVAHVTRIESAMEGLCIKALAGPLRYRYAIISSRHRPVSVLAQKMRDAWRSEVLRLLDDVGAEPWLETGETSGQNGMRDTL